MSETITKLDIRQFELPELQEWFKAQGQAPFRAKQVFEWLWQKSAFSFEEMTNLSKDLRKELEDNFVIQPIVLDKEQHSNDGTIKSRFKLHDGHLIESVLIPVTKDNRYTVCVSCQVGCSLSCGFCATGLMERKRNLTAAEIYDQVVLVNKQAMEQFGHPLTNIVYMGMGEPLLTYREVKKSIEMITSPSGLGMSPRRITVSTAGIAKVIRKMADDDLRVNLALSLHAADDEKRDKIMPINEHNNLDALKEALIYFHEQTKNKISYEYIAFQDFNVTMADARNLLKLCKRFPVRVNVIEYNTVEGLDFVKAREGDIDEFAKYLRDHGVMITVRRSRGKDIDAACGQLANKD
jgi:23S rRNA (adenine2503-C2)-methyltransferase